MVLKGKKKPGYYCDTERPMKFLWTYFLPIALERPGYCSGKPGLVIGRNAKNIRGIPGG
jgi:hypothetical protein